jgi:hypothetical protein
VALAGTLRLRGPWRSIRETECPSPRPWELGKTQSIDVIDGVGSAIRSDKQILAV